MTQLGIAWDFPQKEWERRFSQAHRAVFPWGHNTICGPVEIVMRLRVLQWSQGRAGLCPWCLENRWPFLQGSVMLRAEERQSAWNHLWAVLSVLSLTLIIYWEGLLALGPHPEDHPALFQGSHHFQLTPAWFFSERSRCSDTDFLEEAAAQLSRRADLQRRFVFRVVTQHRVPVSVLCTEVCTVSPISTVVFGSVKPIPDPLTLNQLGTQEPCWTHYRSVVQEMTWFLLAPVQVGVSIPVDETDTGLAGDGDTPSHCHRQKGWRLSQHSSLMGNWGKKKLVWMQIWNNSYERKSDVPCSRIFFS